MQANLVTLAKTVSLMYLQVDRAPAAWVLPVEGGAERSFTPDGYLLSMQQMGIEAPTLPVRRAVQLSEELMALFPGHRHRVLHFLVPALGLFCSNTFIHEEHVLTRIYPIQVKFLQFAKQYIRECCTFAASSTSATVTAAPLQAGAECSTRTSHHTADSDRSAAAQTAQTETLMAAFLLRTNELCQFGEIETMNVFRLATQQQFTPLVYEMAGAFLS